MKQITVLLAEDHMIVREGLRKLLATETDLEVVGEAETGRQAVALAKKLRPAVVVMDIAMPLLNGLEATRQIHKILPGTKVLMLSAHSDDAYVDQAIAVGAHQLLVLRYTDTGYKTLAVQSPALAFTVDKIAMAFVERTEGAVRLLLAQYLDGGFSGPARPLHPGDIVILYLTGIGRKAATFAEGAAPKTASKALESIQVLAQGQAAQVLYAGVQPQFPGLDQVNVQLPKYTLPAGKTTVTLQIAAASTGQVLRYEIDSF